MWGLRKNGGNECSRMMDLLEMGGLVQAKDTTLEELLVELPEGERRHVLGCPACHTACQEWVEARKLLAPMVRKDLQPGPFFVNRVMAAIRAREDELKRSTKTWAAVPRLAARLAGVAIVFLLLAGTLFYEGPRRHQATVPSMEQGGGAIFEDNTPVPTSKDEVLVSLLEKGQ